MEDDDKNLLNEEETKPLIEAVNESRTVVETMTNEEDCGRVPSGSPPNLGVSSDICPKVSVHEESGEAKELNANVAVVGETVAVREGSENSGSGRGGDSLEAEVAGVAPGIDEEMKAEGTPGAGSEEKTVSCAGDPVGAAEMELAEEKQILESENMAAYGGKEEMVSDINSLEFASAELDVDSKSHDMVVAMEETGSAGAGDEHNQHSEETVVFDANTSNNASPKEEGADMDIGMENEVVMDGDGCLNPGFGLPTTECGELKSASGADEAVVVKEDTSMLKGNEEVLVDQSIAGAVDVIAKLDDSLIVADELPEYREVKTIGVPLGEAPIVEKAAAVHAGADAEPSEDSQDVHSPKTHKLNFGRSVMQDEMCKDHKEEVDGGLLMSPETLSEPYAGAEEEKQVGAQVENLSNLGDSQLFVGRLKDVGNVKEEEEEEEEEEVVPKKLKKAEFVKQVEAEGNIEAKNAAESDSVSALDDSQVPSQDEGDDEVAAGEVNATPESEMPQDDGDEATVAEEETANADTEMEIEADVADSGKPASGKRKRGKNFKGPSSSKVAGRAPSRKVMEEDVCFICFDGGELVLCDRRGCPKAYHTSCVNRDEAFFRAKGRWCCGWHLCSICEKNAYYMCYTCPFSLCKGCTKDAAILCVRGNKGFCETCLRTIRLIEDDDPGSMNAEINFDDKTSWEYLFKDYYIDLKNKLSLSLAEIDDAKNPRKGHDAPACKVEQPDPDGNEDGPSASDDSAENQEIIKPKRKKIKKRSKSTRKEEDSFSGVTVAVTESMSRPGNTEWATKELLEFVKHMKNGDTSVLSQFDVQALLLEYIKMNKLRDPRRKSQIVCDSRLELLFGKPRVGHFEMLKLLESHFLTKEDSQTDDFQGSVVDTEDNQMETDVNTETLVKGVKDRKRKSRKKGERRGLQSNLDDYAAIDMHNISLIYLRRKLMEDLLEDVDRFHTKVVGTFVRIRISGTSQKQDIYRLVQVVGTSKAAEPYKIGKTTADVVLEILNLNKTEATPIDTISNQEFTEEECKRLRQSIKCGLISRLTVGDILGKATELHAARVNDWLESEIQRLSHLRDRASEKGRKKELRECVEKLQLLKTPEERRRRLEEIPEIHDDPKMDPSYESEEDSGSDENKKEVSLRFKDSGFSRRGRGPNSPASNFSPQDSWTAGGKIPSKNWESERNLCGKNILNRAEEYTNFSEIGAENSWNHHRDMETEESKALEKPSPAANSEKLGPSSSTMSRAEPFPGVNTPVSPAPLSSKVAETAVRINETEKVWHYQDPSGKVQGPFSMVQLRKWSNTGYFPADLRIWRTTEKQDDSVLLTDALTGKLQRELPSLENTVMSMLQSSHVLSSQSLKISETSTQQAVDGRDGEKPKVDQIRGQQLQNSSSSGAGSILDSSKLLSGSWGGNDASSLPSPTPRQGTVTWAGGDGNHAVVSTPCKDGNAGQQPPAQSSADSIMQNYAAAINASSLGLPRGGIEVDSASSASGLTQAPSSERGPLGKPLEGSQLCSSNEAHALLMQSHLPMAKDIALQPIQSANVQIPNVQAQSWTGTQAENTDASSGLPSSLQLQTYGQWPVTTSSVQNPAGNFSNGGPSVLPELWRPPTQGSQPNMQSPNVQNVPWVPGLPENNVPGSAIRPENPNVGWSIVQQGNPNLGWGGPVSGSPGTNWSANIQGMPPVHSNPGWVVPTMNLGTAIPGPAPGNVGWMAAPVNPGFQGLVPGNANPAWIAPAGNLGSTVQGPVPGNGWSVAATNAGGTLPGQPNNNVNQGWGAPSGGSPGLRGSNGQLHGGGKYTGPRENDSQGGDSGFASGRPWNRQSGGGGGTRSLSRAAKAQTLCPFNANNRCRKGASCDYLHS